jgi:hypothetical protein
VEYRNVSSRVWLATAFIGQQATCTTGTRASRLRELVTSADLLAMPGVYVPVNARLSEAAGFAAVQCSG